MTPSADDYRRVISALVERLRRFETPPSFLLTKRVMDTAPPARLVWGTPATGAVTVYQERPFNIDDLRYGDRVVTLADGRTGRYLGKFDGRRLALFADGMDNVELAEVAPHPTVSPSGTCPVPTDRELEAAIAGLLHGEKRTRP